MPPTTQLKDGLRTVGGWLLGFAWIGIVFAGLAVAFSPSKFPPAAGWALLTIAAFILLVSADRWVKALPGILGVATINSLVMIATGHATSNPSVSVTRLQAISATILLAVSTILAVDFQGRKPYLVDRVVFLIYAMCLGYAVIRPGTTYWALGTATAALFVAWSHNRLRPGKG